MPNIIKPKKIKKTKKLTNLPTKIKSSKTSPVDYYNCLLLKAQSNSQTGKKEKISQSCKDCKTNAPKVNQIRNSEISKLITSYHQVGESLKRLLKPIK